MSSTKPKARCGRRKCSARRTKRTGSRSFRRRRSPAARGGGVGFGVSSRPVGAFVIKGGEVSWQPALDLNRVILMGQVVAIVALLTARAIVKALAKRP